jgi:hypothetical protein
MGEGEGRSQQSDIGFWHTCEPIMYPASPRQQLQKKLALNLNMLRKALLESVWQHGGEIVKTPVNGLGGRCP